jgi:hypothetical protein
MSGEKNKNIYRRYRSQRLRHLRALRNPSVKQFALIRVSASPFKAFQAHSRPLKAGQPYSRVSGKKIDSLFVTVSVASVSFRQSRRSLGEGRCSKQPKSTLSWEKTNQIPADTGQKS